MDGWMDGCWICISKQIRRCVVVCVCVYVYIYIYIERERDRYRYRYVHLLETAPADDIRKPQRISDVDPLGTPSEKGPKPEIRTTPRINALP